MLDGWLERCQRSTMMRAFRHRENWITRCQEMLWRLQLLPIPNHCYKGTSPNGWLAWRTHRWILQRVFRSTNWKDTSHDSGGIAYIIGRIRVTIRFLSSSTGWRWKNLLTSFTTGFLLKGYQLRSDPGWQEWYTISRCRYQLMHPVFPDSIVSDWDSVSTSKSWSPRYHFWAWLRLPPTRLLWEHPEILWLHAKKTFSAGLWHSKSLSAGPVGLRAWI